MMENQKQNVQLVLSYNIALQLCCDYPYFVNLIRIEKNKKDPQYRVWVFSRSPEFDEVFNQLKADAVANRVERESDKEA